MNDAPAAPLILDTSVLIAIARADLDIIGLLQGYDAQGRSLVIPALAITGASLDAHTEEGDRLLTGLGELGRATVARLTGAQQALRLATAITRTGLDPWDAHVAAVAVATGCPILTLAAAKWQQPSAALDQPLHIIEITDPGD